MKRQLLSLIVIITIVLFTISKSFSQTFPLKINIESLGIVSIGDKINISDSITRIDNIEQVKKIENYFQLYKIRHIYSGHKKLTFMGFPVHNLALSIDNKGSITAIHMDLTYSKLVIDSLKEKYGSPMGATGLASVDQDIGKSKDFSFYGWYEGKIIARPLRNSLFYNETGDQKDLILLTFTNGNKKDYLKYY